MTAKRTKTEPHLVPSNLVGQRFPRNAFGDIKIALIGYCPPPSALEKYNPTPTDNQYFIHGIRSRGREDGRSGAI
jgi:hypothetical protein